MRYHHCLILLLTTFFLTGCAKKDSEKRTLLIIPVYGQSLAMGEEAIRITNFDSLSKKTHHHVLTENLDEEFGYLSDTHFKQWMKKITHDRHRAFELAVYGMSEIVSDYFEKKGYGDSLIISTFPGGQGATSILDLGKDSKPYKKFVDEIAGAYKKAKDKGWDVVVPAFVWMQGEDDITWKKSKNYKKDLNAFQIALNKDIKTITNQSKDVVCISYQTNCLTLSEEFNENTFNGKETSVPEGQLELIQDNPLFMGIGPTYPYSFVDERVHIDGLSQKRFGYLLGLSVIRLLESQPSKGLTPDKFNISGDTAIISFNVPAPPLVIDTTAVLKAANYGFSVIDPANTNILQKVIIKDNLVKLYCKKSPVGSKVRYAVNGLNGKSGYKHGPRGNLRDSQGEKLTTTILNHIYPLHNWAYQFDVLVK